MMRRDPIQLRRCKRWLDIDTFVSLPAFLLLFGQFLDFGRRPPSLFSKRVNSDLQRSLAVKLRFELMISKIAMISRMKTIWRRKTHQCENNAFFLMRARATVGAGDTLRVYAGQVGAKRSYQADNASGD